MRAVGSLLILLCLSFGSVAPAAGQSAQLVSIEEAWVRVLEDGTVSAYFTIRNNREAADRLVDVTTPAAGRATLYRTRISSTRVRYTPVQGLEIGGDRTVRLRPGGYHVRLENLARPLTVGDVVPLTVRFERAGRVEVTARVSNQLLGNR